MAELAKAAAKRAEIIANRSFLAYLLCAACADTGFWIYSVGQGWLVLSLTNSPFWLGIVAAAGQLPYLLFTVAGGSLADRFSRRFMIAGGNVGIAILAGMLALVVARGAITIAALSALAFGIGTLIALEHPIDRAWLYDLVAGKELGRAIALSSLEFSVARTIGPAIGGALIAAVGVALGYGTFAAAVLPMSALALSVPRGNGVGDRGSAAVTAPSMPTLGEAIVPFCLLIGAFTMTIAPYITLLPDLAKNELHQGARGFGVLSACGGVGAIAGAIVLAWTGEFRWKGRLIVVLMVASAALLATLTFARSVTVAGALLAALGAVDTLMYALANTYVQQCAGDAERGRANGYFSIAFLGGIPIGNFAIGTLAGRVGTQHALLAGAVVAPIAAAIFALTAPVARDAA